MSDTCTWVDCQSKAERPQVSKDGEMWANLCVDHDNKFAADTDIAAPTYDVKRMLSSWVKAGGGAEKMAKRMAR